MSITREDDVLGGEPRIDGTRIGVRHVATRAIETGQSPAHIADQLECSRSSVSEALSYSCAHIDEMRALERTNEAAVERVRESSVKPKGTIR